MALLLYFLYYSAISEGTLFGIFQGAAAEAAAGEFDGGEESEDDPYDSEWVDAPELVPRLYERYQAKEVKNS